MRQLKFLRGAGHRERGAVMTVFAAMVAGGVALSMLALSVDVGNIMYERRQLQNAADSTVLALANECAQDASLCTPDQVEDLLDPNAKDNLTQYDTTRGDAPNGACGRATGSTLPECLSITSSAPADDLHECPPLPTWLTGTGNGIPYVETYTLTESTESNPTLLPRYFSQLLVGGGTDASVNACARAAWGPPGSYSGTVPIVISACEWKAQTVGGTNYVTEGPTGPRPGYGPGQSPWPGVAREEVIILHDPSDELSDCMWNGKDTAGGFGFVESSSCSATVTTDGWVQIDPGASPSRDCRDVLPGLAGTTIALPVFDCIVNSGTTPSGPAPSPPPADVCDPNQRASGGNNTWYHVVGWAKFYLSGYSMPGAEQPSIMPGGHGSCGLSGAKCLYGWFLKGTLDDADSIAPPGTGEDFGTYVVLPAG